MRFQRPRRLLGFAFLALPLTLQDSALAQCQVARLVASDGQLNDNLGTSAAIAGDWGFVASTRTSDQGGFSGSVYVAQRTAAGWAFVDKLLASDGTAGRVFGSDVSADGDRLLVGSKYGAYTFERGPAGWTEVQRLLGSDTLPDDGFGRRLCLKGDRALVTATVKDSQGESDVGAVYLFESGPNGWTEVAKLEAPDGREGDYFGGGLALGEDLALVGAPGHDLQGFSGKGAVYVFEQVGGVWSFSEKVSYYPGNDSDAFGGDIDLVGDRFAVTASGEESIPSGLGAAHIYQRTSQGWVHEARLLPDGPVAYGFALHGLDMDEDRVFVTGYLVGDSGTQGGRILVYKRTGAGWRFDGRFGADQPMSGGTFGTAVSVSGDSVLVGARGSGDVCNSHSCSSGAAFVFDAPLASTRNICSALPNSTGDEAVFSVAGCTSLAANEISLCAQPVPDGVPGLFVYGDTALAPMAFGDGLRCVGGQVFRVRPIRSVEGVLRSDFDLGVAPHSGGHIVPGSTWYFQAYYRDRAAGGSGFNSSDAVEVLFKD